MDSVSLIDIGVFRLPISSHVSVGRLCLSKGIGLLHLGYQICGQRVVHSIPLLFF